MPNVRASSGMIGTIRGPIESSRHRLRSRRVNPIVVLTSCLPDPARISSNGLSLGSEMGRRVLVERFGSEPSSALRRSIMYWYSIESWLGRKYGGSSAWIADSGISSWRYRRSRQTDELLLGHLLDLVRRVAALEARAERPALDRLGEDDRRPAAAEVLGGGLVRGVQLAVVVAAARQGSKFVVREMGDDLAQARVGAEEVVADVLTALDRVALELPVEGVVHLVDEHAVLVEREQLVPLRTPNDLDHVPTGTAEHGLELLDDLAVAADGPVEPLQVAVDDEDQVVELLA